MNPTGVPHPDWYDAHGSWDGSLSIPRDSTSFPIPGGNGITAPVVLMTAVPGTAPPNTPPSVKDRITMAIVRATKPSDPFLLSWTKDAKNPINYTSGEKGTISTAYDTPGQVCFHPLCPAPSHTEGALTAVCLCVSSDLEERRPLELPGARPALHDEGSDVPQLGPGAGQEHLRKPREWGPVVLQDCQPQGWLGAACWYARMDDERRGWQPLRPRGVPPCQ